ncbi:MAG: S8 family serine peptidase [Betaproteobacteria bacterium]
MSTLIHLPARLLAALPLAWAASTVALTFEGGTDALTTGQIVVKLRPESVPTLATLRVAELAATIGAPLTYRRTMAIGAMVLNVPDARSDAEVDAIAAKLATRPDVIYAERSRRMYAQRVPNDPLFADQFYLQSGATTIDAPAAWELTTGSPSTVIAVLDTGYTNHSDLVARVVAGYDMVSSFAASNDGKALDSAGNYRDADASDPGDWISADDRNGLFASSECVIEDSTWHGTSVMGTIGAIADNGNDITGVDWKAKLVPVRVLGKCFGSDADIADGVAWAGGLNVPAAPVNANPAHVINLSLGGPGACQSFMQETVDKVFAHGVTRAIVASAGNQASGAVHSPSSCNGVISVAASTFAGNRAGYSNFGPRMDIAAPGGNGVAGSAYNFLVLTNLGKTVPAAEGTQYFAGTSFSAPLVSGVAGLMLAVAPDLSPAQLRDLLKSSAKPFPAGSTCLEAGCGAGLLDAPAAVRAALATTGVVPPVSVVEFYNAELDHYFITWVSSEIALLDAGTSIKGWQRTGLAFNAYPTAAGGTNAVCRIYIPPGKGDGHYFGRDQVECDGTMAKNPSFVLESPTFFYLYPTSAGTCATGTIPLYRVFSNRADANHRYTTDRTVRDKMVTKGWLAEGDGADTVVMCAPT